MVAGRRRRGGRGPGRLAAGRERAEEYAELVESTVNVRLPELFDRFDEQTHSVRARLGHTVTERFRKGSGARRR